MRPLILIVNHTFLFFGTTLYVGVLWALRFFWYPSWDTMTLAAVTDHFVGPTGAATKFFTIVVPIMFVTNLVLVVTERKQLGTLVPAALAFSCIGAATYVGTRLIIPTNKLIAVATSDGELDILLQRWMDLNDIRFVLLTLMWLFMMQYFIAKGRLLNALNQ